LNEVTPTTTATASPARATGPEPKRYELTQAWLDESPFDDYATGVKALQGIVGNKILSVTVEVAS